MEMKLGPKGIEAIFVSNYLHFECSPFPDVDVKLFNEGQLIRKVEVLWSRDDILDLLGGYLNRLIIGIHELIVESRLREGDLWGWLLLLLLLFLLSIVEKYLRWFGMLIR